MWGGCVQGRGEEEVDGGGGGGERARERAGQSLKEREGRVSQFSEITSDSSSVST